MECSTKSVHEVFKMLGSSRDGLTESEVTRRRAKYGWNELPKHKRSLFLLLLRQFNDFLIYILIAALALSLTSAYLEYGYFTMHAIVEASAILAILLLNGGLGFIQEYKAEQAIELLQKLTAPHCTVRRNGKIIVILSRDIVPGDVVLLETGDRISADGRLFSESHIEVNESTLTGESLAVSKTTSVLKTKSNVPADLRNMVFAGTLVTRGSGEYLVTSIGAETHIGAIATMVASTDFPETPLKIRLRKLGKMIGIAAMIACVFTLGIGLMREMPFFSILLIAVSLAVSAVPEGLPAVLTVCLALGVRRMVSRNALVRRLDALETLGSVTVICADKTGTITENRMRVVLTWVVEKFDEKDMAVAMASCNRARLPDIGDPTEIGLLEFADELGVKRREIEEEIMPFNSEDKYMITRHGKVQYIKGAPEKVIALCKKSDKSAVLKKNHELAARGLRVLGCAIRKGKTTEFIGLVGMDDPPRQSVPRALEDAKQAGIRTIMITGDSVDTASAIARQVGIIGDAIDGQKIDKLNDAGLRKALKTTSIFARVSPEHKVRILTALQKSGEVVAMSGDGVNDAPALKQAHVGVAMGKVGTDVARDAASVVLTDDDYATIVAAVHEGRRIYDNIRKFVLFLLRANFADLVLIVTTLIINVPLPYLPLHILWINLVTDSFPALALGMERPEPDIMSRPPRRMSEGILSHQAGLLVISGIFSFGVVFLFYLWQLSIGVPFLTARTATFTLAIMLELSLAMSVRSSRPIIMVGFFSNPWMLGAIVVPILMHMALLYTPISTAFSLVPISLKEWQQIGVIVLCGFLFFEALKIIPQGFSLRLAKKRAG